MARRRVTYTVEFDREADGRWIADVPALSGCLAYGDTRRQALASVRKLAGEVIAEMQANREPVPVDHGAAKFTLTV